MAAGKRLVGSSIPGCGVFVHEPKPRDHAAPPKGQNANKPLHLVEQEEKRVNDQLVDILERKCAKQRSRADEETQRRTAAEAKLEAASAELDEVRHRLEERDRQVAELCTAQRDLASDRLEKTRCEASLREAQTERDELRSRLKACEAELKQFRANSGRNDTEWKDQVVRLVAEMQAAQRRADEMQKDLEASQAENEQLIANAQDVVRRYEAESAQRLELESRCLTMEEKMRSKDQKTKSELDSAQAKAKQHLQARERADDLKRRQEEKLQHAEQRADAAETKCRNLEAEVQRLKSLCARRAEESERQPPKQQPVVQSVQSAKDSERQPPKQQHVVPSVQSTKIPPPPMPRAHSAGSRPNSNCGVDGNATPKNLGTSTSSKNSGKSSESTGQCGTARMPPGAIRRAGSVPARKGQGRGQDPPPGKPLVQQQPHASSTVSEVAPTQPSAPRHVASTSGVNSNAAVHANPALRESSVGSRPGSRASSAADRHVEDVIPSEPDSSDEEVLIPVRAKS